MALFSYKRYYKPGKGVEKDAPQKNAFFRFFELYGRKLWRFIEVNFLYLLILLPILMTVYAEVYDTMYTVFEKLGYTGTCASWSDDNMTVTANTPGASGNDYVLNIEQNKDGTFTVTLYTDRGEAAEDSDNTIDTWFTLDGITTIDELAAYENDYVTFAGSGELYTVYDVALSGGDGLMSMFTPLLYLTMLYYQYIPTVIRILLLLASMICCGPAKCGVTYVLRNYTQESHSWISDIWDKAKENLKQGIIFGLLDCFVAVIVIFDLTYQAPDNIAAIVHVSKYLVLLLGMFYVFMRKYIYLMIVTVNLNLKSLVRNAWLLSFIGIFRNVFSALANLIIWIVAYLLILAVHPLLEIILIGMFIYSFTGFLSIFACYPLVDKYLVQPIAELQKASENPDESESDEESTEQDDSGEII